MAEISVPEVRALRALRAAFDDLAPKASSLTRAELMILGGRVCDAVAVMQCADLRTDRVTNTIRDMALSAGIQWIDNPQLNELIVGCVDQLYAHAGEPLVATRQSHFPSTTKDATAPVSPRC